MRNRKKTKGLNAYERRGYKIGMEAGIREAVDQSAIHYRVKLRTARLLFFGIGALAGIAVTWVVL